MLQEGYAGTDVHGVLEVVAGDEDGSTSLLVVLLQEALNGTLAGGVEEVEGLVQDEHLGLQEHGTNDAHLLLVAGREVADEFLLSCHLARHELLKVLQEGVHLLLLAAGDATDELEVLVGREIVNQEGLVHEGTCPVLPVLRMCHIHTALGNALALLLLRGVHEHTATVGLDKVQHQAEERALASTVVANETQHLTVLDLITFYIHGNLLAKGFLQVFYLYLHSNIML